MAKRKVHYVYDTSACGCGDSWCSDCRDVVTLAACSHGKDAPRQFTTTDVAKVSCESCASTPVFTKAFAAKLDQVRAEAHETVKAERDKYKAAIDDLVRKCNAMQRGNPKTYYIEAPTGTLIHRSVVIDVLALLGVHVERGY